MTDRRKIKQLIKFWIAIGAIGIIVGYGGFRAKNLVTGPELTVSSPASGTLLADPLVEIKGTAKNISFLTLNDNKIYTDESGVWSEKILLSYGYNVMTVKAKDRFGRTTSKTLQLMYK
jgi:hypothetical protein